MRPSQSPRGGGQHFHQSDHIPSATSLKHLPGYKAGSHHSEPPTTSQQPQPTHTTSKESGGQDGGGITKSLGGDGITKGLLDSVAELSKLPVWKPSEKAGGGGTPTSTAASTASSTPAVVSTTPSRSTIGMFQKILKSIFSRKNEIH